MLLYRCDDCGWRGQETDICMVADPAEPNPNRAIKWHVCPKCRQANQFTNMCDEPSCREKATCGWPSDQGYRRTCEKHWNREKNYPLPGIIIRTKETTAPSSE